VGCEIAGVGKNIIALTVGMAVGLGMGDNTQATVITRGLAEITRLGVAMGADDATFSGLAGLGDLVATCSSPLSRNRTFGERLGMGLTLAQAIEATSTTAEAVKSARPLLELAIRHGETMPITEAVVGVIEGALTPTEAVRILMSREKRAE
jgi:glycerol-3-phosphate dehydrogenase (NAD(P)+)